jgi:hypothetical protein
MSEPRTRTKYSYDQRGRRVYRSSTLSTRNFLTLSAALCTKACHFHIHPCAENGEQVKELWVSYDPVRGARGQISTALLRRIPRWVRKKLEKESRRRGPSLRVGGKTQSSRVDLTPKNQKLRPPKPRAGHPQIKPKIYRSTPVNCPNGPEAARQCRRP